MLKTYGEEFSCVGLALMQGRQLPADCTSRNGISSKNKDCIKEENRNRRAGNLKGDEAILYKIEKQMNIFV